MEKKLHKVLDSDYNFKGYVYDDLSRETKMLMDAGLIEVAQTENGPVYVPTESGKAILNMLNL